MPRILVIPGVRTASSFVAPMVDDGRVKYRDKAAVDAMPPGPEKTKALNAFRARKARIRAKEKK